MNPFETLSDDPILHICSYLHRVDLLKLSRMDKNFYRIITESKEITAKIPLVLDFSRDFKLPNAIDDVTELTKKRRFTALQVQEVYLTIPQKFTPLLQHLSGTVEHLTVTWRNQFNEKDLRKLIQMFLPTLKTCKITCWEQIEEDCNSAAINDEALSKYPLSSLSIGGDETVKFFGGCKQLKSFECCRTSGDRIYDFLSQQTRLEKLTFYCSGIDFGRINCLQLKELSIYGSDPTVFAFLGKLPNLTKLEIKISDQTSLRPALTAICKVPKLKDLNIITLCQNPAIPLENPVLVNHTVKKLRITNYYDIEATTWLLEIFRAVEFVSLSMSFAKNFCDPSNVPHETINRIKIEHISGPLHFNFSPRQIPVNIERFESAVMKFAEKMSTDIGSITVGHQNWLNKENFSLSNSFCESLVNQLPNLFSLELYKVADCGKFFSFLDGNRQIFKNLENVKFHKSTGGEPPLKKIKFEIFEN